jgi:hypothetical protein
MGSLKDFKVVKNFLNKDEINLISMYCEISHRNNIKKFDRSCLTNNADSSYYADYLTESLLLNKKNIMEKESGLKLLPTYSFWRTYTKYATLIKHKDRPSCEISVTVSIANDGTDWPIFMNNKKVILKPGEAAIYRGCDVKHHREELLGDYQTQIFLHYVDANGPHKECNRDKRKYWGEEKDINDI